MKSYQILGMMSGTSLDGLDLALVSLQREGRSWNYRFLHTACIAYSSERKKKLEGAIGLPAPGLLELHSTYGTWLGKQAAAFLQDCKVQPDAIASHGHTVHHQPEAGFTFQLGCPQHLALASGCTTIGDFRSLDVALGGQGAPLVPIGDELLFGNYDFCLNLGGISNLSFKKGGARVAFDVGICNMLLNYICARSGLAFDPGGEHARSGIPNKALLQALDNLDYYRKPFPKSTGYEWFRDAIVPMVEQYPDNLENLLRTAVLHIIGQIAAQIRSLSDTSAKVLVTGGGAQNTYLMEELQAACGSRIECIRPESRLIDYKEALVFAFLGALRLENQPNVLASVTGAKRDSCSGTLYNP